MSLNKINNLKVKINSEKSPEPKTDITEPKTKYIKYIRLFSLLPHKQDFNINSVHITETCLSKLFSTCRFKAQFPVKPSKSSAFKELFDFSKIKKILKNDKINFDKIKDLNMKKEMMKKQEKKYIVSSIYTDGYKVSILLCGKKSNKFSVKKASATDKAKVKREKDDELAFMKEKEKCKEKPLLGLDPGSKDIFNFYSIAPVGLVKNIGNVVKKRVSKMKKRKTRKKKKASKKITKPTLQNQDKPVPFYKFNQEEIFGSYSTDRYYHESKVNAATNSRRMWLSLASNSELMERFRDYLNLNEIERKSSKILSKKELGQLKYQGDIISTLLKHDLNKFKNINQLMLDMPTNRTSYLNEYKKYIEYSNQHAETFHEFNLINSQRKWRYKCYVFKYKVFEKWFQFLNQFTIGFGDYNQKPFNPIRGKRGPVNEFRDYLVKKEAKVVHVDEFCTSKKCYSCGSINNYKRYIMYRSGRIHPSFGALCCSNSKCGLTIDRDLNASKNIHHLLHNYLYDMDRPSWLLR